MMREKCTEKSRHSMPGNRRKKTAEYRGEQNKGKPAFNAGEKKKENHGIPRGKGQRKAGT